MEVSGQVHSRNLYPEESSHCALWIGGDVELFRYIFLGTHDTIFLTDDPVSQETAARQRNLMGVTNSFTELSLYAVLRTARLMILEQNRAYIAYIKGACSAVAFHIRCSETVSLAC
jgi:lysylphosphatidylglycerol synthetase-like protein (DUF2156 family)